MLKSFQLISKTILSLVFIYLVILMVQICINYFPWTNETNFLVLKQDVVHTQPWRFAFQVHVLFSSLVLLAGFTQFSKTIRRKAPQLHRRCGWFYIVVTLGLALPSGFILALDANGGFSTQLCFVLLSGLWGVSTVCALYFAIQKQWLKHRNWMIRSFALALSALSLRTWKLALYQLQPFWDWLTPIHIYQLESWLGWTVNLIIAELIIYRLSQQARAIPPKNSESPY